MPIEDTIKQEIIAQYKSLRAFTQAIGIPYSTIDTMLKKGVHGTSVQTVIKVCDFLKLDLYAIAYEILHGTKMPPRLEINTISNEAMEVARAYDKAKLNDKNYARFALKLPQLEVSEDEPLAEPTNIVIDKKAAV